MCCTCKNNALTGNKGASTTISSTSLSPSSSSLNKNSYFQNDPALFKVPPYSDPQTLTNPNQFIVDEKDTLVPMLSNDGEEVNNDHANIDHGTNQPFNFKESLPAPVNQYAIDRIIQENNLQKPIFGQQTDEMNTIGEITTNSIPYNLNSRNYLLNNQINEKHLGNDGNCGNSCDKLTDYSSHISGMQTGTTLSPDYEELRKPEQGDKKDYYDEVINERNAPIASLSHPRLRERSSDFIDIAPEKLSGKLLQDNVPGKITLIK